jgi:hypothetical protein
MILSMVGTLVHIRIRQLGRQSKSPSFIYVLLAAVSAGVAYVSYTASHNLDTAWIITGLLASVITLLHSSRADSDFVYHHIARPQAAIVTEYLVCSVPVWLPVLFTQQWYCALFFAGWAAGLSFLRINRRQKTRFKQLSSVIAPADFELLSGSRKQMIPLTVCYVAALAFAWVKVLPLFLLWLMSVQVMAFYSEHESIDLLRANGATPRALLHRKLLRHPLRLLLIYIPVVALNAFFYPDFIIINILFLFLQASLLCFAICYKYTHYDPRTTDGGSIITGLISLSGIVPFLLPLPAIMCISYYFRAIHTLKTYLND